MVKGCLKVSILFKTDILPKCFAPNNAQLVILNHSYVEVFFWSQTLRLNEVQLYFFNRSTYCPARTIFIINCSHTV